jgi:hypothetical protein
LSKRNGDFTKTKTGGFLWISLDFSDFYGFLWISMDFLGIFPMIFRRQQGARVGAGGS